MSRFERRRKKRREGKNLDLDSRDAIQLQTRGTKVDDGASKEAPGHCVDHLQQREAFAGQPEEQEDGQEGGGGKGASPRQLRV